MKNLLSSCLFLLLSLCSCSHYYYVANVQNVPLFREKNEYRVSGAIGTGDKSHSVEIQAAYSLTGNMGIMSNFMSVRGGVNSNNENWAKGNFLDAAIGYYKPINKYGVFEIYGGIGGGNQHHYYMKSHYNNGTFVNSYEGISDLLSAKIFIQPSIGLTTKVFDIAFSTRLSRLSFTRINNGITGDPELYNEVSNLSNKGYFFIEPAVTVRGGWTNVKVQLQAAYSGYLNKPELYFGEEYHLSVGLLIALGVRHRNVIAKEK